MHTTCGIFNIHRVLLPREISMGSTFQFPVYVIASQDGIVVVKTDGKECILLFHASDLAHQQIKRIQVSHPDLGALRALLVPDADALRIGLESLPPDITCAVWDPTGTPGGFS